MAKSVLVLLRSSPYGSISASEALRHINGGVANLTPTAGLFLDDGVFVLRRGHTPGGSGIESLEEKLAMALKLTTTMPDRSVNRARLYAHGPSLAARGLTAAALAPGVQVVDDAGAARLLAEAGTLLIF